MIFKCKVLGQLNQKCNILYGMDFRQSLDSHILPYGLHREWYQVTDLDLWFESDLEKGCILIKYRTSKNRYCFVNNGLNYGRRKVSNEN